MSVAKNDRFFTRPAITADKIPVMFTLITGENKFKGIIAHAFAVAINIQRGTGVSNTHDQ